MDEVVGSGVAAQILGVSRSEVQRLATGGVLPPYAQMPGLTGARLFRREDVEELAAKRAKA